MRIAVLVEKARQLRLHRLGDEIAGTTAQQLVQRIKGVVLWFGNGVRLVGCDPVEINPQGTPLFYATCRTPDLTSALLFYRRMSIAFASSR